MADPAGRVARSGSPLSLPRRSGRVVRASSKTFTALNTVEKVTAEANEINERNARSESVESEFQPAPESRKPRSNGETGRSMFQKLVELLEKSHEETREFKEEMKELKQKVTEQTLAIAKQDELIGNLNNKATQQGSSIKELQQELRKATAELTEVRVQLETFAVAASRTAGSSPQATYAEIARTPPGSAPSNIRTLSSGMTTPSTATDMFYCTIDYSRVTVEDSSRVTAGGIRSTLEREMRTEQESATWRCRAKRNFPKVHECSGTTYTEFE
ncbi:hypothetical protein ISF_09943 [Cordyceps fumosorosea ARSEF 2679]|uniref:Uncharacterized protein n=1 Tax=Cordyceps fumosorosea (strain ARSEF 2679) TaxID=1081104 RepID=A0A166YA77_CORFA|nr:hypothetical protein ISF_09943 [Cordyceps fumosorosea ARSEF 2679]OAA36690.1 hypothetical protein ISF_09943 [Cordyceps fumosorosea ARSEF 2679]